MASSAAGLMEEAVAGYVGGALLVMEEREDFEMGAELLRRAADCATIRANMGDRVVLIVPA